MSKIINKNDKLSYNISKDSHRSHHDIYHKHKDHFDKIEEVFNHLKKLEGIEEDIILEILNKKDNLKSVPVSVFSNWLAPLEALVVFMKENLKMTFSQIAKELKRDSRTIWLTYSNARKKNITISIGKDNFLPIEIFSNREFSVLENLAVYLHDIKGYTFKEISNFTKKDNRTIWTVYHRAKKKMRLQMGQN